jgi:lipopolysaccharide/colanic/teichoic acid biosynthesis glycosyltransferase
VSDYALEVDPGLLRQAELLFALGRRHGLPFSVVALIADERREGPNGRPATRDAGRSARIERCIAPLLRGTDVLLECGEPGQFMLFCPGTDAKGATELCRRLRHDAPELAVATGSASFGAHALTLEDLIDCAWSKVPAASTSVDDDDSPRPGGLRLVAHGYGHKRSARSPRRRRVERRLKRVFDLVLVGLAAPFWLTTFGLVALAIKLSDPSAPVLFVQLRTGRGGRRFPMYKFRTMVPDAEALKEKLREHNELVWPDFKIKSDPRITRIGKILRKTSLDELPQLLNVLRGDMSLVGPRPTSFEPTTYAPWQTARLDVQPGLTGLWQVEGRAAMQFDDRIRIELDYIERQSLLLDLWILLRTVPAVLQMRGGH